MTTRFYDIDEIASLFLVDEKKVRRWIAAGEISAVNAATKANGKPRIRVSEEELEAFTRRRTMQPETTARPKRKRIEGMVQIFK